MSDVRLNPIFHSLSWAIKVSRHTCAAATRQSSHHTTAWLLDPQIRMRPRLGELYNRPAGRFYIRSFMYGSFRPRLGELYSRPVGQLYILSFLYGNSQATIG